VFGSGKGLTVKHLRAATFVAVLLSLAGCDAEGVVVGSEQMIIISDVCEPDSTAAEPLLSPEAQARSDDQSEAWALFFNTFPMPDGEPIAIPVDTEIKIVWSVTGTGDFRIEAVGPNGVTIQSNWEPTGHLGSNWERPGDEWDTGWTFPEVGCWTFQIQGGDSAAQLSVDIHDGDR
jgi:hypothetical protein